MLVTAAIIEQDGKFLVTQRPDDGRNNAGRWEFPGGKVDFGEDPRACLERELKEELGIDIKAGEIIDLSSHIYFNKIHVVLIGIKSKIISGEIENKDISDHKWLKLEELDKIDICESDIPIINKLKEL